MPRTLMKSSPGQPGFGRFTRGVPRNAVSFAPRAVRRLMKEDVSRGITMPEATALGVGEAKASLTTALSGANNDLTYTARLTGEAGNDITVAYLAPATPGVSLTVGVTGTAISVTLPTNSGTAATLSTDLTGTNNDLTYTAVTAGTAGNSITITYVDPGADDQPLYVTVVSGTTILVHLGTDGTGTITSTAANVRSVVLGEAAAAALVGVVNKAGNDGSGLVTAMSSTPLAGGVAVALTGTTASQVRTAVLADSDAAALVSVALATGNSGAGNVTVMTATPLAGGKSSVRQAGFGANAGAANPGIRVVAKNLSTGDYRSRIRNRSANRALTRR